MTTSRRARTLIRSTLMVICLAGLVACKTPNNFLRQQGITALERGDLAQAQQRFQTAAAQDPTDWKAQYYLGSVLLEQGQPLDAQLTLEKARSLRPAHAETPDILDKLAEAIYQQNRREALVVMLDEAASEFGAVRDFLRQGDYLARIGEVDLALIAYQKAVRFAVAGDPQPYLRKAAFHEQIGDSAGAIQALRHAYHAAPNDPAVAAKLRQFGIVPGPTVALPPEHQQ